MKKNVSIENEDKRKYRRWYAIIRDNEDAELRIVPRTATKQYYGLGAGEDGTLRGATYGGDWVFVTTSQDVDMLRAYCRLIHNTEMYVKDPDAEAGTYYKYMAQHIVDERY